MEPELKKAIEALGLLLKGGLQRALTSVPQRTNLLDSSLYKSIDYRTDFETFLDVVAYDYIEYIDTGRKPKARLVPYSALLEWIKKYKINTRKEFSDEKLATKIRWAIYWRGIEPRPFLLSYINNAEKTVEDYLPAQIQRRFESKLREVLLSKQNE